MNKAFLAAVVLAFSVTAALAGQTSSAKPKADFRAKARTMAVELKDDETEYQRTRQKVVSEADTCIMAAANKGEAEKCVKDARKDLSKLRPPR